METTHPLLGMLKYKCYFSPPGADTSGESKSKRDRHMSSSPESKPDECMTCPLCQEKCRDRTKLESHVMQVHSVNSEGLQRLLMLVNQSHWLNNSSSERSGKNTTNQSSSSYNNSSDLKSDSNDDDKDTKSETESFTEDSSELDELFRCQTCNKSFRSLDELCGHQNDLGHLEIKQTPGGPGYLCWKKGCNQYFPTAPSLQMHFREIHANRAKQTMAVSEKHVYKYRCNQCSLAFKTMEKLQLHSQYHAIRDASKCCLCGRSFRSLVALQKHVETSHTELNEDELIQFKQSIANNPLLLAGLSGQVLDPATTELLKKESARGDEDMMYGGNDEETAANLSMAAAAQHHAQMMMMREDSGISEANMMFMMGNDESGDGENSNDSLPSKDQQLYEDYLNSQTMAEDSYNDPNRKYKCHRCKVAFTRQNYLTSHNKTLLHRKGEKLSYPMEKYLDPNRPYKCEVCKESFTQKNILLVHYNSVSHLHKLKRAMQEQQQFLSHLSPGSNNGPSNATATATTSSVGPISSPMMNCSTSPTGHHSNNNKGETKQGSPNNTSSVSTNPLTPTASSLSSSSEDDDKKPFKCNICKVAYSQGSTLDIHMRSVLHQTRASKLQELALTGQIDLTKPLIEQPDTSKLQEQQKKMIQDMLLASPKVSGDLTPLAFSTPARSSSPAGSVGSAGPGSSQNSSPVTQAQQPNNNNSGSSSGSQNLSCPRCNVFCGSPEQLFQHQHLYCIFPGSFSSSSAAPNLQALSELFQQQQQQMMISPSASPAPGTSEEPFQRFTMPSKKSSQIYKHLLESYGFEVVMQFLEYHQKPSARDEEDDEREEPYMEEFPELMKSICPCCRKQFSSVWILKAHCEEVHKDVVSMEDLEQFADNFKAEYQKKMESGSEGTEAKETHSGEAIDEDKENVVNTFKNPNHNSEPGNPTAPSTPTTSTTPGSTADSVSGHTSGNNPCSDRGNNHSANHSAAATSVANTLHNLAGMGGQMPNLPISLAQNMNLNDVQAALSAMAASQLQHFNPMNFNPMMMAAGLGMSLPLGLNMNALAAMNLQPPLVPMMMPPPFDPMNMNNMAAAVSQASPMFPPQDHSKSQSSQQPSSNASNSGGTPQQKRARTRITDEQLKILRSHFDINNSPSEEQIQNMAQQSGLPPKVIKHWFRNTLFKERQRNKDSPYNFSNPPSTTLNLEEYEKTGEAKVAHLAPEDQKHYAESPLSSSSSASTGYGKKEQGSKRPHAPPQLPKSILSSLAAAGNPEPLMLTTDVKPHVGPENSESDSRSEDEVPRKKKRQQQLTEGTNLNSSLSMLIMGSSSGGKHSRLPSDHNNSSSNFPQMSNALLEPPMLPPPKLNSSHTSSVVSSASASASTTCLPLATTTTTTTASCGSYNNSSSSLASASSVPLVVPATTTASVSFPSPCHVPSTGATSLLSPATSPMHMSFGGGGNNNGSQMPPRSDTPGASCTSLPTSSGGSITSTSGKRANRTRFTDYQIKVLQEFFENNAYPKDDDLEYLSKLLGLSPRVIVVWFQNARQKARKVYENQPPVDTQEEGTGRFQRTPGLNYQCKKCLLVFQRYYELIRHQKTHCYKEEDAKRSAQAQAAAAQIAANMSSEESNSSSIECNSFASSSGPNSITACGAGGGSSNAMNQLGTSGSNNYNTEMKMGLKKEQQQSVSSPEESFQCDKCNLVFPRFDLWREHQLVHIMNPNLFPSFSPESAFGILQQQAAHAAAAAAASSTPGGNSSSGNNNNNNNNNNSGSNLEKAMSHKGSLQDLACPPSPQQNSQCSSIAGDATSKRKWSADEITDDDDQPRDKRLRTTILPEQLDYLYQKYQLESNPSRKMLESIARDVGLKKRVVQVWFQNTRARERKGQFRAHAQVINKRCPFCPALFKVKSALETHLAAKHADQYAKGEINIDALPDEDMDSASSSMVGDSTKVPISFGATQNSVGGAATSTTSRPNSPSPNSAANNSSMISPFLHSLSTHAELESSLKKLYEESLKRYAQEVQQQQSGSNTNNSNSTATSHNGRTESTSNAADLRTVKTEMSSPSMSDDCGPTRPTGEAPLDLSKPVDLSHGYSVVGKNEPMDHFDAQDYLSGQ